jgi:murein DD-endopeptidase MepM/ murein hydrolase activator NlpD
VRNAKPRSRRARARALTSAAGLLVAFPVAGWLLIGSGSHADSASSKTPSALPSQPPAGEVLQARATTGAEVEGERRDALRRLSVTVSPGDTLIQLLQQSGLSAREAFLAVKELQTVYSPRKLKPGQDIQLALSTAHAEPDAEPRLKRLRLRADAATDVALARTANGGFEAKTQARSLSRQVTGVATEIDSSLFAAGQGAGVPAQIMLQLIHQYSYAVDFQRDLRAGDRVEIVYERFLEAGGEVAKTGPLLYAGLQVQGERLEMYRYTPRDGQTGYFAPNGDSVRRLLMRTPIDGARLSSGYGMRKHPIEGYTRMHEGVDFAAPPGTPIYASGTGRVTRIGYNGGYGNYVRIDHGHGFVTAYGHLRGFKQGLARGDRVAQGQVIGYVGNTGQSTGPHLHYEIHKRGEPVNPRSLELPTGRTLTGAERDRFQKRVAEIDRLRQRMPDTGTKVAQIDCPQGDGCQ